MGVFRRITEKLFPSRQAPARTTTQASHVREKTYGGSTKDMARAFGVTERTVQRWVKGTRTPKGKDAEKLETAAAAAQVTDRGRERRAKQMEKNPDAPAGMTLRVRLDSGEMTTGGSDVVRHNSRTIYHPLRNEDVAAFVRSGDPADLDDAVLSALADYFDVSPSDLSGTGNYDVDLV